MDAVLQRRLDVNLKGIIYIRDALSFYLTDVRKRHNQYNICIIVISLVTALFEALKNQMEWVEDGGRTEQFASLCPIFLATFTGFISSMLKFERLADKIEETTKSIEKCHNAVNRHREALICSYNNRPINEEVLSEVNSGFRDALLSAEIVWLARMDPMTKNYYLLQSSKLHDRFLLSNETDPDGMLALIRASFVPIDRSRFNLGRRVGWCCRRWSNTPPEAPAPPAPDAPPAPAAPDAPPAPEALLADEDV